MPEDIEEFFPLWNARDRLAVRYLAKVVRLCLRRDSLTPAQIRNIAVLLHGIERLPLATPGLAADVTLTWYVSPNDKEHLSVTLRSNSLSLCAGGYVHTECAGRDSYGDEALYLETGGFRDIKWDLVAQWLDRFQRSAATAEIELVAGCEEADFDWDAEPDETAWERAAKQHEESDSENEESA